MEIISADNLSRHRIVRKTLSMEKTIKDIPNPAWADRRIVAANSPLVRQKSHF